MEYILDILDHIKEGCKKYVKMRKTKCLCEKCYNKKQWQKEKASRRI